MRAISFVVSLLLFGVGLAACESGNRSGNASGSGYSDQMNQTDDSNPKKPEGGGGGY